MNIQKFTQKSIEAIQNAQSIAIENQNAQIEQEHLLLALLEQDNSLIRELLKKMGVSENFEDAIRNIISRKPRMSGGARPNDSIYVSQDVDLVLNNAEKIEKCIGLEAEVQIEYNNIENFKHYCKINNIFIVNFVYSDKIFCNIQLQESNKQRLIDDFETKKINLINIKFLDKKLINKSIIK